MNLLEAKLKGLREGFLAMRSVMVAFSGGVDSSFVLRVAHDAIGDRVLALTTTSPTMPEDDRRNAIAIAQAFGVRHVLIESNELEIAGYASNPANRCYLCKHNLFTVCIEKARELGIETIVDGLNLDDLHDYRPGIKAAAEMQVRHPLVEAELTKAEIRELSHALGLPTWDRPASPCLSSRFPYGTQITLEGLRQVERGEQVLRAFGFRVARVRYHGDVARIEVDAGEIARMLDAGIREAVDRELKKLGFRFVALDLRGFRSGSLNEALPIAPAPRPS
jgi:pyridinium-3,5-biscarboxylic acid mononucleotide sulfurtransferase